METDSFFHFEELAALHEAFVDGLNHRGQLVLAPLERIFGLEQSLGQADEQLGLTHSVVVAFVLSRRDKNREH